MGEVYCKELASLLAAAFDATGLAQTEGVQKASVRFVWPTIVVHVVLAEIADHKGAAYVERFLSWPHAPLALGLEIVTLLFGAASFAWTGGLLFLGIVSRIESCSALVYATVSRIDTV